jgi:hypothetical protein
VPEGTLGKARDLAVVIDAEQAIGSGDQIRHGRQR